MERIISRFPLYLRQFFLLKPEIRFKKAHLDQSVSDSSSLSLVTWNILADGYADPFKFYYVQPEYLKEDHRMQMICYDLLRINSDIICLQEVEERNFDKYLLMYLDEYSG